MSFSLNKVMLMGRSTSDLEVKVIPEKNISVVNFTIATNRAFKGNQWTMIEESEFHRCTAYGSGADILWKYLTKWKKIFVEGRLRTKKWNDASGISKQSTNIIVDTFIFVDSKQTQDIAIDNKDLITNITNNTHEDDEDSSHAFS